MKIKELKKDTRGAWIIAKIIDLSPSREFEKFGQINYVAHAIIKDKTGKITLTLWNDQIHLFKKGDKIKIDKGYITEFQGKLQLNSKMIVHAKEEDLVEDEDFDKKFNVVPIGGKKKSKKQSQ